MLTLPGVTLVCIDTVNHALALRALLKSRAAVNYGRTVFLTDALPHGVVAPPGVEIVTISPLASRDDYSRFVLKQLLPFVETKHLLLVQWDGYAVNPQAWDDAFSGTDYLGAKWYWYDDGMRVGNGGFSLRSRKLLQALQDPRIALVEFEDTTIGRAFRPLLERDYGIRFADEALADRFAFEAAYPIGMPFGFHGLFNFCRVMPSAELAALASQFSDAIAGSLQMKALLRNCVALSQWPAVSAVAGRILLVAPTDSEAQQALTQASANSARSIGVGRNDPCPCGSGRRYKLCHGSIDAPHVRTTASTAAGLAPAAWVARGIAAHQRHELEAAERDYRTALAQEPGYPLALHYLGVVHYQRHQLDEALLLLERAVQAAPHEPEFHNNLGLALAAAQRTGEAVAAFRHALALKPDHFGAWSNLGLALQARNEVPGAVGAFRRALELAPNFAQSHWNLALALLAQGDYADGFREYEWRFAAQELAAQLPVYAGPRWDGGEAADRTILLTAEQGLGDTLQAIRFAPLVAARGARVIVSAQPALKRLLASAPGVAAVYGFGEPIPAYDAHVALLSLAGILDITPATIPAPTSYLTADPARASEVGDRIRARSDHVFNVGICWAGATDTPEKARRSCPLSTLSTLFALLGIRWFSLQSTDIVERMPLVELDARRDFDGTAALVSHLDLVLSIDTSIAHLAGALGKPVWVMLRFAPDWRWMLAPSSSPWYPTARLFRQPAPGDWSSVVQSVGTALTERLRARVGPVSPAAPTR
ncbi:MAG: DUF5672 family protein [Casimicrobiaceae bacterium]